MTTSDSEQESDVEILNQPIKRRKNNVGVQFCNEHLYGPLEVTAAFSYETKNVHKNDTNEIIKYAVKNYNAYDYIFDRKTVNEYLDESIFTRIIRINLDHITPIIGLLYVTADRNSYYIAHLSIHHKFRRQGLAKMLLSTLAEFIKVDRQKTNFKVVNLMVNRENLGAISLYQSIGFKPITRRGSSITMRQSIEDFVKITTLDILV